LCSRLLASLLLLLLKAYPFVGELDSAWLSELLLFAEDLPSRKLTTEALTLGWLKPNMYLELVQVTEKFTHHQEPLKFLVMMRLPKNIPVADVENFVFLTESHHQELCKNIVMMTLEKLVCCWIFLASLRFCLVSSFSALLVVLVSALVIAFSL